MPKKTKKEKLLAQLHRLQMSPVVTQAKPQESVLSPKPRIPPAFSLPNTNKVASPVFAPTHTEYQQMKRDLGKTMLLTTLILVSEFLLTRWLPQ